MSSASSSSGGGGYGTKLRTRLSTLADAPSRESVVTLVKWMGFNRKHASVMSAALRDVIVKGEDGATITPARRYLYLSVAHECLLAEKGGDPKKWARTEPLRREIGGTVLIPAVLALRGDGPDGEQYVEKVKVMANKWMEGGVFGSGSETEELVNRVRLALVGEMDEEKEEDEGAADRRETKEEESEPMSKEAAEDEAFVREMAERERREREEREEEEARARVAAAKAAEEAKARAAAERAEAESRAATESAAAEGDSKEVEGAPDDKKEGVAAEEDVDGSSSVRETSSAAIAAPSAAAAAAASTAAADDGAGDFDFEKQGVDEGKVHVDELLVPCKSIATSQIVREIRNDAAERLSSVLAAIPPEVEEYARKLVADGGAGDDDGIVDLDGLPDLPDDVLDLDMREALDVVEQLKSAIGTQREARLACINLLIRSRCRFGSREAAEAFHDIQDRLGRLRKRKVMLSDAMELEGLDIIDVEPTEQDGSGGEGDDGIEALDWFDGDGGDVKRARTT